MTEDGPAAAGGIGDAIYDAWIGEIRAVGWLLRSAQAWDGLDHPAKAAGERRTAAARLHEVANAIKAGVCVPPAAPASAQADAAATPRAASRSPSGM